ncbi:MAG: hypothetical protein JXR86_14960 [Spirochaetales bacterium]|nr:hypothetical protein [Spirochaetales bacterium]
MGLHKRFLFALLILSFSQFCFSENTDLRNELISIDKNNIELTIDGIDISFQVIMLYLYPDEFKIEDPGVNSLFDRYLHQSRNSGIWFWEDIEKKRTIFQQMLNSMKNNILMHHRFALFQLDSYGTTAENNLKDLLPTGLIPVCRKFYLANKANIDSIENELISIARTRINKSLLLLKNIDKNYRILPDSALNVYISVSNNFMGANGLSLISNQMYMLYALTSADIDSQIFIHELIHLWSGHNFVSDKLMSFIDASQNREKILDELELFYGNVIPDQSWNRDDLYSFFHLNDYASELGFEEFLADSFSCYILYRNSGVLSDPQTLIHERSEINQKLVGNGLSALFRWTMEASVFEDLLDGDENPDTIPRLYLLHLLSANHGLEYAKENLSHFI